MKGFVARVFVFALLVIAPLARAGWIDGKTTFAKGTWTAQTYGNYISAKGSSDEILASGAVGVGYFVFDNAELNLELLGYHVTQDGPDADAISLQLMLRHHFIEFDRFSLFVDVGVGAFEGSTEVPQDGTTFNITFRSGPGLTYRLADHFYLLGGARYFHLSNAALEGREHNPSINGVEGYFGVMFTF
ncbi:MAG TPA: acyloxyacyl hydrolase [Tepidisphaeraceae bacterium]|nr:acyloxyacyl hydrolase [Tepidisphaeraceae bacterium]